MHSTRISATNSNTASFRTRQLWFILKIAFIGALVASVAAAGQTRTPLSHDLLVTVTEVKRVSPGLVEIHVMLLNKTCCNLFVPTDSSGESLEIHSLQVLHWSRDKGWLPLGPFSELPSDMAIRLRPGKSYTAVHRVPDPAVTPLAGERIPLQKGESISVRGKHVVRVGYLCGAGEWRAYRAEVANIGTRGKGRGPSAQMKFADSDEFDIPPAKP